MELAYLNGMNWSGVTREERFFCAHLYGLLRRDRAQALGEFLKKSAHRDPATIPWFDEALAGRIAAGEVREVGYEVCFYRDWPDSQLDVAAARISVKEKIAKIFPQKAANAEELETTRKGFLKRTFDLCLFMDDEIAIIEAKAQQSFDSAQLATFEEDRKLLAAILGDRIKRIRFIALTSSIYATPKIETRKHFNDGGWMTWSQLAQCYADHDNNPDPILDHADSTYGSGGKTAQETTSRATT